MSGEHKCNVKGKEGPIFLPLTSPSPSLPLLPPHPPSPPPPLPFFPSPYSPTPFSTPHSPFIITCMKATMRSAQLVRSRCFTRGMCVLIVLCSIWINANSSFSRLKGGGEAGMGKSGEALHHTA